MKKIICIVGIAIGVMSTLIVGTAMVIYADGGDSYCQQLGYYAGDISSVNTDVDKKADSIALKAERISVGFGKVALIHTKTENKLSNGHNLYADFKDRPGW